MAGSPSSRRARRLAPGDRVLIIDGPLAGLQGMIDRISGRFTCQLVVDGLPIGVLIQISMLFLEPEYSG